MSERTFKKTSTALFFAMCLAALGARAADFTALLDRDAISLGETATLSLTFEGGQPKNLLAPDVPGLQIVNAGNSQNFSILNGQMNSTVTITYSITPERTGNFSIPAMTADVNGQQLASAPLTLTVTQPNAPSADAVNSGNEVAFMQLSLPSKKIYDGQMLTAQLKIYLRDDVQNFGNVRFNAMPADGFEIGKNAAGERYRTQVGNRVYTVVPLDLALTATKTGALTLGPFAANMVVVLPSQNDNSDPFIRDFFNRGEQKQISLTTQTASVEALPLPDENKPANFSGAIGDFTMTASIGPTNLTVGDPVTIRLQISGTGDLGAIQLPDQSLKNFKTFSPTSKTETTDRLGLEGKKTFEEIITPENSDVHELPPFSFSFFNPDDGQYHMLTQPAVPLIVQAAGATPMPAIAANKNSAPENQTPQDILPIKENLGTLAKNSAPLVAQPVFLAVQSLPVLAFLAALIWRKRADNLANNPRLRRQRAVAQLVQIGIDDLKKFAAENNSEEFFALLFRLLQEQLGERLNCAASAITENVVEENSILRGAPDATRNDLRELFQLCNQARYAPVRGTAELNSVVAQFEKVGGELQEVKA
ncbi:MAG TPA: BatD family protein [Verrucomicrobiae bacterium]